MKKLYFLFIVVISILFIRSTESQDWNQSTSVSKILNYLGNPKPMHALAELNQETVKRGEELVKYGKTTKPNGSSSKFISKHYTCTSCHNLIQEDPDLRQSNPDTRLPYVKSKGIPFLQGTTFYGMVNRETWYNDDYQIKYGDLAVKSHKDLQESIQLCAEVCSQGRRLDDWELNAILSYVWTLDYKLQDLGLKKADYEKLNKDKLDKNKHEELRKWITSFYALKSPANFTDAPKDKHLGYEGINGRPEVGKDIYDLSCKNCHHENGESDLVLDDARYTFRKLRRNFAKENHFSIYKITRYGTHPIPGHRPYMPHYTLERMSHQQVEDLRAYIEQQAG